MTLALPDLMPGVSRALASGRTWDAYTALRRCFPRRPAGRALLELARTELPDRLTHRQERLTESELSVLRAAADGLTVAQTGRLLGYSPDTIKGKRRSVIAKAGARNMVQAVHILLPEAAPT